MTTKIKETGNYLWEHRNKIMAITLVILAILYLRQCGQAKYERKKAEQNQHALTQAQETIELKNGEIATQKATFVASEKELKDLNEDLHKEVEKWKEEKSKVKVVIKTKIVYRDRGETHNTVSQLSKNKYELEFDYEDTDGVVGIAGRSEFKAFPIYNGSDSTKFKLKIEAGKTYFDTISVSFGLTLGVKQDNDGIDRVFATPSTKKISITDINSVQLEDFYKSKYKEKPKRITIGPQVGLGLGIGSNGQLQLIPQVGVGVQYSLIKF